MGNMFKELWFKGKQMHKRRKLKRKMKKRECQSGRQTTQQK
jgi:hypothetical protein